MVAATTSFPRRRESIRPRPNTDAAGRDGRGRRCRGGEIHEPFEAGVPVPRRGGCAPRPGGRRGAPGGCGRPRGGHAPRETRHRPPRAAGLPGNPDLGLRRPRAGTDHSRAAGRAGGTPVRERTFRALDGALARHPHRERDGRGAGADAAAGAARRGVPLRFRAARRRDLVVPLASPRLRADGAGALRRPRRRGAQPARGRPRRAADSRRLAPCGGRQPSRELRRPARLGPRGPHRELDHGQRRRRVEPGGVTPRAAAPSRPERGECADILARAEGPRRLGGGARRPAAPGPGGGRAVRPRAGPARGPGRRRGRGRG